MCSFPGSFWCLLFTLFSQRCPSPEVRDLPTPLLFVAYPARSAGKVLKVSCVFSMSWFPGFLQPWFTGTPVLAWGLLGVQGAHATQESSSLVL